MNLLRGDRRKRVYAGDNNQLYTMINMATIENWQDDQKSLWRLIFSDEINEENEKIHIEAQLDDEGNYNRFLIDYKNQKRSLVIRRGLVVSDRVYTDVSSDGMPNKTYTAKDEQSDKPETLSEYLLRKQKFKSALNEKLHSYIMNNDLVTDFLNINTELIEDINDTNRRSK